MYGPVHGLKRAWMAAQRPMIWKALERLKTRLLVWIMIKLRLRPRALHGFNAAKLVQEERDD